jgi:hypothetical protein
VRLDRYCAHALYTALQRLRRDTPYLAPNLDRSSLALFQCGPQFVLQLHKCHPFRVRVGVLVDVGMCRNPAASIIELPVRNFPVLPFPGPQVARVKFRRDGGAVVVNLLDKAL